MLSRTCSGRASTCTVRSGGGERPHSPFYAGVPPCTPEVFAGLAAPAPTMRALRPAALLIDARGRGPLCTPPWVGLPGPHPGNLCGTVVPAPTCGRSTPRPGLLSRVEKVGKDTPRAVPFGIPWCRGAALFALAYASRRATSCHQPRPICHFGLVGKSAFVSPQATPGVTPSAVNPWRGS